MSTPRLPRPPSRLDNILTWATDVQGYLRSLTPFSTPTVLVNHQRTGVQYTGSAASSPAAAATITPWQPYAAPYLGSGSPPADQGLNIMVCPGTVWDGSSLWLPSMLNQVFAVPANCTGGFYVWLDATIGADGIVTALDYGSGIALPDAVTINQTDSAPPAHAYDLLFIVTSSATAAVLSTAPGTPGFLQQMRFKPLALTPNITGVSQNGLNSYRMIYTDSSNSSGGLE